MSYFSKYAVLVFSRADYSGGVGYSSVSDDFPVVFGNEVLYDTVTGVERPTGRHPVTNEPLWVLGYDRYTREITTHGVCGASAGVSPPYGVDPDVCSLRADVTAASVIAGIDGMAKHVVYGAMNVQPGADPDDLPPALVPYYVDSVMPSEKWDEIYAGLVARGVPAARLDTWIANNPDPTPLEVHSGFASFVAAILEKL